MHSFLVLQDAVERIHIEASHNIPDNAVNILFFVALKPGVTTAELISKLDLSHDEILRGVEIFTTSPRQGSNHLGLLYIDGKNGLFLTDQGRRLIGDLSGLPGLCSKGRRRSCCRGLIAANNRVQSAVL